MCNWSVLTSEPSLLSGDIRQKDKSACWKAGDSFLQRTHKSMLLQASSGFDYALRLGANCSLATIAKNSPHPACNPARMCEKMIKQRQGTSVYWASERELDSLGSVMTPSGQHEKHSHTKY